MIDPELAAIVDLLPKMDLADPVAARRAFEEMLAGITFDIPGIETLDIEDRMVPGHEGDPDVAGARLPAEGRRGGDAGARHRHDPRGRLRDRQRRGRARRRGPDGDQHRRRRGVGRLPPGARASLPGRPARLLCRADVPARRGRRARRRPRSGGAGRDERRGWAGGGDRPAGPRPGRPGGVLPAAAHPRARRPAADRFHAGLRGLAHVEQAAGRAELAGLSRPALRVGRRAGLRGAGPGGRSLGVAAGLHLDGRERPAARRGDHLRPTPAAGGRLGGAAPIPRHLPRVGGGDDGGRLEARPARVGLGAAAGPRRRADD